jgi:biotin transport system substrate-specific component
LTPRGAPAYDAAAGRGARPLAASGAAMFRTTHLTLATAWWPRGGLAADATRVVLGSLLVALCAQISIPLQPVPITGQTLGVLLVGALLGSRLGAVALLAYIGEGLLGLPVYAGGLSAWSPSLSGVPVIVGPTLGYLVGFVPAAALVGWLAERGWDRRVLTTVGAMLLGNLVIYACGLAGLSRFVSAAALPTYGLWPFLPGDALKIALAATALPGAWALTRRPGAGR